MKNVKALSEKTQKIRCKDRSTWITLYYSVKEDAVYSDPGEGRFKMCDLINPNTEQDIIESVHYFLNM